MCCDHIVQELINHNTSFKFSTAFGECDCESHKAILVGKCYKNDFFISTFTEQKECACTKEFTCGFCLVRIFTLNRVVHKICLKDEWENSKLLPTDEFLNHIDCKKDICKFINNSVEQKCEHIIL